MIALKTERRDTTGVFFHSSTVGLQSSSRFLVQMAEVLGEAGARLLTDWQQRGYAALFQRFRLTHTPGSS